MDEIRRLARRQKIPLGEWVRRALREARASEPVNAPQVKLKALRAAVGHSFPTGDIDQMLKEIEQGYRE
jgi:chorismate-pyruvate lyase